MRLLFALFLLVMPATVLAADNAQQPPRAVVQQLFADHFMHDMGFTQASVARKRAWMTPGLNQEIDAYMRRPQPKDEPPVIDGDPFTNTQEYPSAFQVGDAVMDGAKANVPVVMTIGPTRRTVRAQAVRQGAGWLIDDLIYEDGSTFRALLNEQP
jgi:hypothetical protein